MVDITLPPRQRLMSAAESRFRRFGYQRTTVDDITAEAGTGKGSLYLHFDSKQDTYLAVVAASLERFIDKASRALHAGGSAPERLASLVQATAEHYGEDELLRASLFGGDELVEGQVSELAADIQRTRIRELLAEVLDQGKREGTVRSDLDTRATSAVLFEIGWAVVRAEIEGHSDVPLDEALEILNSLVGRGIMAPPTKG